jgi:Uma2 family endonuclease
VAQGGNTYFSDRGIRWHIDPDRKTVTGLTLGTEDYQAIGTGSESIQSQELPGLSLPVEQLFEGGLL